MKKGIILVLVLMMIPLVLAVNTQISVQSEKNSEIQLNVLNPDTGDALESFFNNTDDYGVARFISTAGLARVNFSVIVRKEGKIIGRVREFPAHYTGQPVSLDLATPIIAKKVEVNTTNTTAAPAANTTNTTTTANITENINASKNSGITGNVISETASSKSLIIIGAVVLGVILIFLGYKFLPSILQKLRQNTPTSLTAIKISNMPKREEQMPKELAIAEKKLKEAMGEINRLKNQEKIKSAEQKLEEDKKELERLKRGY